MSVEAVPRSRAPVWRRIADFLKRALMLELSIYASIARFIGRRPAVPRGAAGFSFHIWPTCAACPLWRSHSEPP